MGCEHIIQVFFHMLLTIKLYHWETTNFARHKASDELHGKLSTLTDKFIEVYMGAYNRPKFTSTFSVKVRQLDDRSIIDILNEYITFLKYELPKFVNKSDTDLLNIRDEILTEIHQTLYLFTLE